MRALSRRGFLGCAAATAAAPFLLPAAARGANERVTMGLLGAGGQGTGVMRGFLGQRDVQVVAVCDVQESRRNAAKALVNNHYSALAEKDYKGCEAYNDFREVLARPDIDAVIIAPQDHWHAIMCVQAAEAGKDMYCEKPLGVSVRECQAIRDAVRRYGRVFQTGTQQRSDRRFRQACELARNGYLGKIHTVKVGAPGPSYQPRYRGPITPEPVPPGFDYEMFVGPAPMKPWHRARLDWPGWYLIWDYCVGFICNWGVHHLDIAFWGCPDLAKGPIELSFSADYRNFGLCDNVNGWSGEFVYPSGLKMLFSDNGHPCAQGCRFEGTEGWVHVDRGSIAADPPSLLQVTFKPDDIRLHHSDHHQADLIEAIRKRTDPVAPVEAGHLASYFGMIADIAARLNRKLKWDTASERFLADPEADRMLVRPMREPWTL